MDDGRLIFELIAFCLAWWLGLYLLARDLTNRQLRFTGLGLAIYALALAASILGQVATDAGTKEALAKWGWPLFFLPSVFWFGAMIYLLPDGSQIRQRLDGVLSWALLPFAFLLYLFVAGSENVFTIVDGEPSPGSLYPLFALIIAALLLGALLVVIYSLRSNRSAIPLKVILIATLFFGLGTGLLLLPLEFVPSWLFAVGLGFDLALLGLAIAVLDAFGQGESFQPDFFRSFTFAFFVVLIFGGQVALAMIVSTGTTFSMTFLLLAIIVTSVIVQTFADPLQTALDRFVFRNIPRVRHTREDLRLVSSAEPRKKDILDPVSLSEDQFARMIRRALSQMSNLPRLAASPLTRLSIVGDRLEARDVPDNTLERASELRTLLAQSIDKLKPVEDSDFGVTDSWRYYNALYYPYVVGLKPYSRRPIRDDLEPEQQQVLAWFQGQVPERTLHNWQNAAAKLVALNIRELSNSKQ